MSYACSGSGFFQRLGSDYADAGIRIWMSSITGSHEVAGCANPYDDLSLRSIEF